MQARDPCYPNKQEKEIEYQAISVPWFFTTGKKLAGSHLYLLGFVFISFAMLKGSLFQ
jgi:hypothetical protein